MLILFFAFKVNGQVQDLYSLDSIQEIRIKFADEDWHYALDSLKQAGSSERLIALECSLNGIRFDSIGVRYKGNSSYNNIADQGLSKLPFNIKLNSVKKAQNYQGFTTLKLSNGFRDPSFLREVISYEFLRNYLPAPQANFIKVYVNGTYLGLYTSVESLNKTFLRKTYGTANGNFFKCDPNFHAQDLPDCLPGEKSSLQYLGNDSTCYFSKYERKSEFPDDWEQLIRLTRRLNHQPEKLEDILNINEVLWMLAYNNVMVNLDSYSGRLCHNYYLFRDSTGQFRPLIWDLNMSVGGFPFAGRGRSLSSKDMQELNPLLHYKTKERPLISKILQNGTYRKMYIDHIRQIAVDLEKYVYEDERPAKIQASILEEVANDQNKFYTNQAFKNNLFSSVPAGNIKIIGIKELIDQRLSFLKDHPLLQYAPSTILQNVEHKQSDNELVIKIKANPAASVYLFYRQDPAQAFLHQKLHDDGQYGDENVGDGIFTLRLENVDGMFDYYVFGETEQAGTFLPARSPAELYSITIE